MIGWIAFALSVIGVACVAPSRRWSLLFSIAGCVCWGWEGYALGRLDLLAMNVIVSLLLLRSYWKWNTPSTAETSARSSLD